MDYFCLSLKILTVLGRRGSKQLSGYQAPSECYYFSYNSTKGAANSFFFPPLLYCLFCFAFRLNGEMSFLVGEWMLILKVLFLGD